MLPNSYISVIQLSHVRLKTSGMVRQTILVIEDEPDALELIQFNLKAHGYRVTGADTGEKGLQKATLTPPNLIVLDLMLPGLDGLELCKILKRNSKTAQIPIIMVTAKATELDRVLGLELGADDYLVKPFSPRELMLRIDRLLKAAHRPSSESAECINAGDLAIDIPKHEVTVCGKTVTLTKTEFKLLTLLAKHPERVLSRDRLLEDVWEYNENVDSRTVDTHIRRLRSKLGRAARHLATVRGFGYRFQV
jgi:DNA-binding response OmpR family regulator